MVVVVVGLGLGGFGLDVLGDVAGGIGLESVDDGMEALGVGFGAVYKLETIVPLESLREVLGATGGAVALLSRGLLVLRGDVVGTVDEGELERRLSRGEVFVPLVLEGRGIEETGVE